MLTGISSPRSPEVDSNVRIIADEPNNALLILATGQEYRQIQAHQPKDEDRDDRPQERTASAAKNDAAKDNRGDAPIFKAMKIDVEHEDVRLFMIPDDEEQPALPVALGPTDDTHAFVLGLGRNRGDSVRLGEHEGKPSLWYSGWRFEKAPDEEDDAADRDD